MKDKVYLVTGSMKGIGRAIAIELLQSDFKVVINSPSDQDPDKIKTDFGDNATFIKADISIKADLEKIKENILEKFGHLDGLVANAGIMPLPCGINDITEENIDKTINVNLKGTFWTLKILGGLVSETSTEGLSSFNFS
jgi:3-oxoacyl-[acyl-carrier protein] reductase